MASTEWTADASAERPALLFRVGTTVYGCDVDLVREVVPNRRTTRIPGAPAFVRGLLNVRGNVLTVLDVGMRLEPDRHPVETAEGSIIIVHVGSHRVGLVVDEVLQVRAVPPEGPENQSENQSENQPEGDAPHLVRKLGHLDGRIVLLLDVPAFVTQALV